MARRRRKRKNESGFEIILGLILFFVLISSSGTKIFRTLLTSFFTGLAYIAVFAAIGFSAIWLLKKVLQKQGSAQKLTLVVLQKMDWRRYEIVCLEYFKAKGYKAEFTKTGADGGIDIILKKSGNADKELVTYVQCKAWSQRVDVKPVRELYGVMAADNIKHGLFMSVSDFTADAEKFAEGKELKLITGSKLLKSIALLPKEQQEKITKAGMQGDYKTPSCASCDVKMVLRTSNKAGNLGSQFWGCKNFPRCKFILKIKASAITKPKPRYF